MKNSFVLLGIIAAAGVAALTYLRSGNENLPEVAPVPVHSENSIQNNTVQGGDTHGQRTENQSELRASKSGKLEASARPAASRRRRTRASSKIPKNSKKHRKASAEASGKEPTGLSTIYGKKVGEKTLYGVPVETWVQSQKNHLHAELPEQAPGNVRVYVQCMEVKDKGLESLNSHQCRQLRIKSSFDSIARVE
ncbi:MAG: hypothetical protein KDD39_04210 [Bdellovibrionales bacterium]|nr:hypothetical protein [Bdellovibrionales bacterium]